MKPSANREASPARRALAEAAAPQRETMAWAGVCAVGAMIAGAILLALSGWFLAGAALAGAAGATAVVAFNYMLPSALIRLLAIGRTAARYLERLMAHAAALRTLARLRPALFGEFCARPARRTIELSSGEASALLVQDMSTVEAGIVTAPVSVAAISTSVAAALLVALASPWASLAFVACVAALVLAGARYAPRALSAPQSRLLESVGQLKMRLHRHAAGTAELEAFDWRGEAIDELMRLDQSMVEARAGIAHAEGALLARRHLAAGVAMGATLILTADKPLPLAALAVLAAAAGIEAAGALLLAHEARSKARVALARLDARLDPGTDAATLAVEALPAQDDANRIDGRSHAPPAILGIHGPTGAGKTRLLGALRAHYGESHFAWLPQQATLLTGTVRENLQPASMAASGDGSGDEVLWIALEDAALADRVRALPRGLESWIGDGGEKLSGGERRRLALARAYLKDAPWLMLDEPTEGLDGETEARVVEALASRLKRKRQGALIVSHRAAPLALAQERIAFPLEPSSVVIGP